MYTKGEGYRCFRGEFRKDQLTALKVQKLLLFQFQGNCQSSRRMPLTGVLWFLFGSDVFAFFFPSLSAEFPCKDSHGYFYNEFFIISNTVLLKAKRTENSGLSAPNQKSQGKHRDRQTRKKIKKGNVSSGQTSADKIRMRMEDPPGEALLKRDISLTPSPGDGKVSQTFWGWKECVSIFLPNLAHHKMRFSVPLKYNAHDACFALTLSDLCLNSCSPPPADKGSRDKKLISIHTREYLRETFFPSSRVIVLIKLNPKFKQVCIRSVKWISL